MDPGDRHAPSRAGGAPLIGLPPLDDVIDALVSQRMGDVLELPGPEDDAAAGTALIEDVLAPAHREIGARWQRGQLTVADEHAATATVDDVLGHLSARAPRIADLGTVALVSAEGEWHATAARMAARVWQLAGWKVRLLAGGLSSRHLETSFAFGEPQILAINCTLTRNLLSVAELAEVGRARDVPVIGGGAAFDPGGWRGPILGLQATARSARDMLPTLALLLDRPPRHVERLHVPERVARFRTLIPELTERATGALLPEPDGTRAARVRRGRTRAALDDLLHTAAVSVALGDGSILRDHVAWLRSAAAGHGVSSPRMDTVMHTVGRIAAPWLDLEEAMRPAESTGVAAPR